MCTNLLTIMIYKLTRTDNIDYEQYESKIVRASSEKEAREIANQDVGWEGKIWTNPNCVKCDEVNPDGPSEELLGSYNAG